MSKSHGHTRGGAASRTYRIWTNMKTRCTNPRASNYAWYGARGITFDPAWASFARFLADMGEAPAGLWLDRIDGHKSYTKDNCRWATVGEQQNNKRNNRRVEFQGKSLTVSELARAVGISAGTLWTRINAGMSGVDAVAASDPPRPCIHGVTGACHQCRIERATTARRAKGVREMSPPTCPKGHLFTPENTKLNNGWRACRQCARDYMRAYNKRMHSVRWSEPVPETA